MQRDPHSDFDHWKFVQFNSLLLEPDWDRDISVTEPNRDLKIKSNKVFC